MKNLESETIPTVGVLAYKNDEVLLVKHGESASHLTGTYGLPSGRIQEGEDEKEAAVREFEEETGLYTAKEDLAEYPGNIYQATIERKTVGIVNFSWHVFIATNFKGELRVSEETTPEWTRIDRLGHYNLLPNVNKAVIDGLNFLKR